MTVRISIPAPVPMPAWTDSEEPEQAPPSPDYIPGLEHADDKIVAEDQPYAEDASPIAQSPKYGPEEDPVDYLAEGGDDDDDEEESSEDDECNAPLPPPPSPIRSLGYRADMIRLRDETASTSSPPLQLPSASRREDIPEVTLPP
nr:hypothetical protein [Tanacetum cinerariifolium]